MLVDYSVSTPEKWLSFAKAATTLVNDGDMTTRSDLLVKISDGPLSKKQPIAWYTPSSSDIVLNAQKIEGFADLMSLTETNRIDLLNSYMRRASGYSMGEPRDGSKESTMMRIRGALVHEAAHSMWSNFGADSWFRGTDRKLQRVITMLDEARIENKQANRATKWRSSLRASARMLLPSAEDMDKIRAADGMLDLFEMSLSSSLVLGRADAGVLLFHETLEYEMLCEDVFGFDRLDEMRAIWDRFHRIEDLSHREGATALECAEKWVALFENEESLDLPALLQMFMKMLSEAGEEAEKWEDNTGTFSPGDMMPTDEAAAEVFDRETVCEDPDCPCKTAGKPKDAKKEPSHGYTATAENDDSWSTRPVRPHEKAAASQLAKRLEAMSWRGKSEVKVRSVSPPGRLKTRAAVGQAAAKSQGRVSTEQPWSRTRRKHTDSPKITVGVMTDVSGSMGWAEDFVAALAWEVTRAVRHVNGTSAAVVFGGKAEPVIGPTDRLSDTTLKVRAAEDGSEAFNAGCASLDGVLRLSARNNGARVLVVVSDGVLVATGEMEAAKKWVDKLTLSGCIVVWVSRESERPATVYRDTLAIPAKAKYVGRQDTDMKTINKIADEIARAASVRR